MLPKHRRVDSASSVILGGTLKSTLVLLESLWNLLRRRGYQSGGSNRSANNGVRPKCVLDRSVKVSIRYSKFRTLLESCLSNALSYGYLYRDFDQITCIRSNLEHSQVTSQHSKLCRYRLPNWEQATQLGTPTFSMHL